MEGKGFNKIETKANADKNGNAKNWQELSDQPPEYWSEEAMKKKSLEELYHRNDGESPQDYKKRLDDIESVTSDEYDEEIPSEIKSQYPDGEYPYGRRVYEKGKFENGETYTYGASSDGYKFIEHRSDVDSSFKKILNVNVLLADENRRRGRDYNRYDAASRKDVDKQRRKIEESNATKTEEQLLRDKVNKAFELYFSQLPKLGFFDLDGQPPAENIYPSESDDYKNGTDAAAIIPIRIENNKGEEETIRQPVTFDLTTGLSKEERLENLIHGDKRGFTELQYPSAESGVRLQAMRGVPNFIIYLPMPQAGNSDQSKAKHKEILDGLSGAGRSLEEVPNKSRLEEFLDSASREELPSREIQDLFNWQISKLANLYRRRWNYEVKRLSELGQDGMELSIAKENRDLFGDIGVYFDERISGDNRRKRIDYLRARNPSVFDFFDAVTDFLRESETDLTATSYSASPDNM